MYYKACDPKTSHDDWISLNLDRIPGDLLVKACGALDSAFEVIQWVNRPEPEDEDDDPPELYGGLVPAQTQCYVLTQDSDDGPALRAALDAAGFELFETQDEHPVEFFFGIDGGGYSFMGQHWIPLRARLAAARLLASEPFEPEPERLRDLLAQWSTDMDRQGEDLRRRCPDVFEALDAALEAKP